MTDSVLEAIDIGQYLGIGASRIQALRAINLAVAGGELTLLMGPSGSGKTTLLSVLGCMLTPSSGTVHVRGQSTTGKSPGQLAKVRRDQIGYVFQSYHLFPTLTALDNVRIPLDIRGVSAALSTKKAAETLAIVGLGKKTDSFPRELSGGEQQRVAIARALVGDPAVILADEPTAALDTENGRAVMSVLALIAKDPARGLLVVTHDPRIVSFADRVVQIEDGRITTDSRATGSKKVAKREEVRSS
jgi:putative ABC transport system ATP-binding protein